MNMKYRIVKMANLACSLYEAKFKHLHELKKYEAVRVDNNVQPLPPV